MTFAVGEVVFRKEEFFTTSWLKACESKGVNPSGPFTVKGVVHLGESFECTWLEELGKPYAYYSYKYEKRQVSLGDML